MYQNMQVRIHEIEAQRGGLGCGMEWRGVEKGFGGDKVKGDWWCESLGSKLFCKKKSRNDCHSLHSLGLERIKRSAALRNMSMTPRRWVMKKAPKGGFKQRIG